MDLKLLVKNASHHETMCSAQNQIHTSKVNVILIGQRCPKLKHSK